MKNICVILSGQPRNYKLGYEELKRTFLDRYKCDVVFHTWDAPSQSATQFFPNRPTNTYTFEDGWKEELLDLYKPIKYKFEQPIVFDNKNIVDPMWRQPLQNSKAMWYSVYQSFLLTPMGYDGYIRARFDIRYEPSTTDVDKLDLSKVNVWDWDTDERVKHRGYYDVFAAGSYDCIGIYSNVFTKIDWYLNFDENYKRHLHGGWPGQDSGLRNEYLLRWHLTTSGVPVEVHKNTIPHADGHIIR
jgi:hypothetical protein